MAKHFADKKKTSFSPSNGLACELSGLKQEWHISWLIKLEESDIVGDGFHEAIEKLEMLDFDDLW